MPTHKQTMVNPADNSGTKGSTANHAALKQMFAASPIHSGEMSDPERTATMQRELLDGEVNDQGHTFGTLNRDYVDAPDYADVPTGAGGLPASPWVPNPASPTGGVNNPSSMPAPPEGYGTVPADNWGSGIGSQLSPKASSTAISGQIPGDLPPNRSS